jgi:hypothetical protein
MQVEPVLEDSYEGMEELAAKTLRPPRRLSAEDLIASELASAALSDPVQKIRHVCEALMFLNGEERRQAGITEEEVKRAEMIYSLAVMFLNVYQEVFRTTSGLFVERSSTIQWPFSLREAEKWKEWLCPPGLVIRYSEGEEDCGEDVKVPEGRPEWEANYALTQGYKVTPDTVNRLKTHFVIRAMPEISALMKKIMRLVSPDSYHQALQILRGGRRGKSQA